MQSHLEADLITEEGYQIISVDTNLFKGIIIKIRKCLRWGTLDSVKLCEWQYVDIWHVTCDMWHLTHDSLHMTCETWRGMHIPYFSSLALTIWVYDVLKFWRKTVT